MTRATAEVLFTCAYTNWLHLIEDVFV